jgi:hypothetical protein
MVKNAWLSTSTSTYYFMVLWFIKHRENVTFILHSFGWSNVVSQMHVLWHMWNCYYKESTIIWGSADKSLAWPGNKQATATKLGFYISLYMYKTLSLWTYVVWYISLIFNKESHYREIVLEIHFTLHAIWANYASKLTCPCTVNLKVVMA